MTIKVYVVAIMRVEAKCVGLTLTLTLIFFFILSIWNLEGGSVICIDLMLFQL